ncbi:MAG: hypothetical protein IT514_06915, partial [Burkholderiales bacterium]|nr:hypothetical protein [Burkholderiales bacterium]
HERRERLGRLRSLALAGALVLAGLASLALTDAARWRTLAQTARLAWDIDAHAAWRDSDNIPLPRLPDGRAVEHSPYTRIAFLHAGLRELARAPLGVGYGRNALRHALQARAQVRLGHTHSGILDLALGGGVPAVVLWFGFLFASARAGWIALRRRGCVAGMLLLLLVLGYAGRMLVDSVNRDHMLQMFFFLAGTVLMLVLPRAPVARTPGDAGAAGE